MGLPLNSRTHKFHIYPLPGYLAFRLDQSATAIFILLAMYVAQLMTSFFSSPQPDIAVAFVC